ncbi:MAG: exodeoxyribonuclease III [Armatimonadetes bacterium]|nr:exodeoxyribonuclease III [Armatimonadota bacterium]MDI9587207.1 exodeoxyribonuclease III [Acidobacteriota bacterium]
MIVASFNVNGIRARLEILLNWLATAKPDVVCLQETKVQDADFPVAALNEAGYQVAYHGQKSYNGVAILSRQGLEDVRLGFSDGSHPDDARLITARVGNIGVINTYVPQGQAVGSEKFAYKLDWLRTLRRELDRRWKPDEPVVWVGDLNVARDDRDVYDPEALRGEVCFHPDEQEALNFVMQWGMEDVFRRHVEEGGQFSFFDYRIPNGFKRKMGWRVDHVMASSVLAERSVRAWIDLAPRALDKPSDHTPICAEFGE